jgi:hypothetical protein
MTMIQLVNSFIKTANHGGNWNSEIMMFDADSGIVSFVTGYTYDNDQIELFADQDEENNGD